MTLLEFQQLALRTESAGNAGSAETCLRILHALLGLQTEVGELADPVKRHIFYGTGTGINRTNMIEEAGDVLWYLALLCDALGTTLEEPMKAVIAKLEARYPNLKWSQIEAENRDLETEVSVLQIVVQREFETALPSRCKTFEELGELIDEGDFQAHHNEWESIVFRAVNALHLNVPAGYLMKEVGKLVDAALAPNIGPCE